MKKDNREPLDKSNLIKTKNKIDHEIRRKNIGFSGVAAANVKSNILIDTNGHKFSGGKSNLSIKKVLAENRERVNSRKGSLGTESSAERKPSLKRTLREVIIRESLGTSGVQQNLEMNIPKKYYAIMTHKPVARKQAFVPSSCSQNYGILL